jgi:hypothetical protein
MQVAQPAALLCELSISGFGMVASLSRNFGIFTATRWRRGFCEHAKTGVWSSFRQYPMGCEWRVEIEYE